MIKPCVCARLLLTLCDPWTEEPGGLQSMGSHGQEYWSELSLPTSGDLPVAGMEPKSLASPALGSRFFTTVPPGKPLYTTYDLPCHHFQVYNAVTLSTFIWLCSHHTIPLQIFSSSRTETLYTFNNNSAGNHHSAFWLYEFTYSISRLYTGLFVSGLFHLVLCF